MNSFEFFRTVSKFGKQNLIYYQITFFTHLSSLSYNYVRSRQETPEEAVTSNGIRHDGFIRTNLFLLAAFHGF